VVHGRRARHVANVETAVTKPSTQVSVFPIQKEALVETAGREKRVSMHEHACARQPVDDDARSTCANRIIDHDVTTRYGEKWQPGAKNACATEETRQHVRIAACASLHRAIGVEDPRSHDGAGRLRVEDGSQCR
jgi:hypothetical protein